MAGPFYFGFRHFQPLANVLGSPQLLVCPADTRLAATNFAALQNSNVSYFIGVNAAISKPASILAGDGNLVTGSKSNPTIFRTDGGGRLLWNQAQHQFKGNILFADAHVEEWGNVTSGKITASTENFILPTISGAGAGPKSAPRSSENLRPTSNPPTPASTNGSTNSDTFVPPSKPDKILQPPPSSPTAAQNQPVNAANNPNFDNAAAPSAKLVLPADLPNQFPITITPPPASTLAESIFQKPPLSHSNSSDGTQLAPSNQVEVSTLEAPVNTQSGSGSSRHNHHGECFWLWLLLLILVLTYAIWRWLAAPKDKRKRR